MYRNIEIAIAIKYYRRYKFKPQRRNNPMKRIIIALLCAFTLFSFASCSGETPAPGPDESGKAPFVIAERFHGTYKFKDNPDNAIRITETTFEIGNMLSGEFTATTHVEDLYENYPDAMLMQDDTILAVQLARNISYSIYLTGVIVEGQSYNGPAYHEINKSIDPDAPIKVYELEKIGTTAN